MERVDRKWAMIIATQGDAYTGKTTLANELAIRLKFPTIRLDDILNLISPSEPHPTPEQVDILMSFAFDLICQIVATQISLGVSVIVDSPLSRLSHLHKLARLITAGDSLTQRSNSTRLLIIECKPNNEYAWQMRFEERGSACNYDNKWYKPAAEWPLNSTPEFSRDYTDDDIPPMVSKLVVNTTDFYSPCHMIMVVHDVASCGNRHIAEYSSKWLYIHENNPDEFRCLCCPSKPPGKTAEHIHMVTVYKQEGVDRDATCGVCEGRVTKSSGGCYTCQDCPLTIHKSCAELDRIYFVPDSFPRFLQLEPDVAYTFTEERPCVGCREEGKEFSGECRSCVFESHLKSRLVPTVVQHEAHEHLLFFAAKSVSGSDPYICVACRKYGAFVAYFCGKCALTTYHPECVLLPPLIEHTHGGHTHELEMVFHRDTEQEDYLCDLCQNKMDPKAWYYHCRKCVVSLHLDCAFMDFDQ